MPLAALALAVSALALAAPGDDERAFCDNEYEVIEKRTKLFTAQGLSPTEIDRRNASAIANLADCRRRFRVEQQRVQEERADVEEVEKRLGPNSTELERERLYRQIRRERLSGKSPASLNEEEKAELAAGVQDELAETHLALDAAHARDRFFMRQVYSALACYHADRREVLQTALTHEESLVKVGTGDRTKLYGLRSDLRLSEDVLVRSREAAKQFPDGLARCTEPQTAVLAHCLEIRFDGKKAEPACESEQIQQYIRFIK